ncbi:MAG: hypothetical protein ACRCWG_05185 [Sarcina sp.]
MRTTLGWNEKGFILTMRNVNWTKEFFSELLLYRFILTMRNVNYKQLSIRQLERIGFILTMRNVNPPEPETVITGIVPFYLNYEECKLSL